MKTTFDLPPDLVRAVKLRARREGRKLKDMAADLLQRGLATPGIKPSPRTSKPPIDIMPNGLPVVRCSADAPAQHMSTAALLALEQESLHKEDLHRLGLPL